MLDNDNIMTEKASEVVQKVPTDDKDYHKCSLCVIFSKWPQHKYVSIFIYASNVAKRNRRRHLKKKVQKLAYDEFYAKQK